MTVERCDQWWIHRLAELEQHARDVANCRVVPLDGGHDDRYKFVHREMAYIVDGIRGLQHYVARLTSTVPPDDRPIVPRYEKRNGCICPPGKQHGCPDATCPWRPT